MEVVGGDLRRDAVDPPEVLEALLKRSQCLIAFEVADVCFAL